MQLDVGGTLDALINTSPVGLYLPDHGSAHLNEWFLACVSMFDGEHAVHVERISSTMALALAVCMLTVAQVALCTQLCTSAACELLSLQLACYCMAGLSVGACTL